jgi:hypothetical protein
MTRLVGIKTDSFSRCWSSVKLNYTIQKGDPPSFPQMHRWSTGLIFHIVHPCVEPWSFRFSWCKYWTRQRNEFLLSIRFMVHFPVMSFTSATFTHIFLCSWNICGAQFPVISRMDTSPPSRCGKALRHKSTVSFTEWRWPHQGIKAIWETQTTVQRDHLDRSEEFPLTVLVFSRDSAALPQSVLCADNVKRCKVTKPDVAL